MKNILSIFVLLILGLPLCGFAQETTKTYCLSAIEYTGSADGLKAELLTAVKREAVREFFGEFISSFTKVENLRITEDTIQATSLGFVRIKGDPEYYQGENLGDVCVKIGAYATEEDFEKFKPLTLTQKSCIMEGDVQTIKEDTEKKAIFEALINYDRRLETYPPEQVLPLLREVTFSDEGFVPDTQVYCARATGIMYPVEVLGTLVAAENTTAQGKTDYTLDLTKYEIGDLPEDLGKNLIVGETKKGEKYLIAHTPDSPGEIEIHNLRFSDTFELLINGTWCSAEIAVSGSSERIIFTYENQDNAIFGNIRKDPHRSMFRCNGCCNNKVKLVVKGKKATLFIDDELFGTVFVKPNVVYDTVIVKGLEGSENVYFISGRNL